MLGRRALVRAEGGKKPLGIVGDMLGWGGYILGVPTEELPPQPEVLGTHHLSTSTPKAFSHTQAPLPCDHPLGWTGSTLRAFPNPQG